MGGLAQGCARNDRSAGRSRAPRSGRTRLGRDILGERTLQTLVLRPQPVDLLQCHRQLVLRSQADTVQLTFDFGSDHVLDHGAIRGQRSDQLGCDSGHRRSTLTHTGRYGGVDGRREATEVADPISQLVCHVVELTAQDSREVTDLAGEVVGPSTGRRHRRGRHDPVGHRVRGLQRAVCHLQQSLYHRLQHVVTHLQTPVSSAGLLLRSTVLCRQPRGAPLVYPVVVQCIPDHPEHDTQRHDVVLRCVVGPSDRIPR